MNKFHVAGGRLWTRLSTNGIELLIFDPANRGNVDLLVGLPAEVQVDLQGQWKDVPGASRLPAITDTVTAIAIALIALGVNIQGLMAGGVSAAPGRGVASRSRTKKQH